MRTPVLEPPSAHIRRLIDAWLATSGTSVRPLMELDNLEAVKTVVASGLGASIVPERAVTGPLATARLDVRALEPPITRTLAVIQRRSGQQDAAERHVKDALLELAASSPKRGATTAA